MVTSRTLGSLTPSRCMIRCRAGDVRCPLYNSPSIEIGCFELDKPTIFSAPSIVLTRCTGALHPMDHATCSSDSDPNSLLISSSHILPARATSRSGAPLPKLARDRQLHPAFSKASTIPAWLASRRCRCLIRPRLGLRSALRVLRSPTV